MYACVHVYMHICIYADMYVFIYVYAYMCIWMCVCTTTETYTVQKKTAYASSCGRKPSICKLLWEKIKLGSAVGQGR